MKWTRRDSSFLRDLGIQVDGLLPPLRRQSRPEVQAIIDAIEHDRNEEKHKAIARGKYEFPPVRLTRPRMPLPTHEERLAAAEEVARVNREAAEQARDNETTWRAVGIIAVGAFLLSKC